MIFETSINHEVKFDKKLIIFNKKSFGKTSIYFLKLSLKYFLVRDFPCSTEG